MSGTATNLTFEATPDARRRHRRLWPGIALSLRHRRTPITCSGWSLQAWNKERRGRCSTRTWTYLDKVFEDVRSQEAIGAGEKDFRHSDSCAIFFVLHTSENLVVLDLVIRDGLGRVASQEPAALYSRAVFVTEHGVWSGLRPHSLLGTIARIVHCRHTSGKYIRVRHVLHCMYTIIHTEMGRYLINQGRRFLNCSTNKDD
jgi:hypothetical protein